MHGDSAGGQTVAHARFLDLPDKSLAHMAKNGLKVVSMPVHFKGQRAPVKAVDFGTNLVVSAPRAGHVQARLDALEFLLAGARMAG